MSEVRLLLTWTYSCPRFLSRLCDSFLKSEVKTLSEENPIIYQNCK